VAVAFRLLDLLEREKRLCGRKRYESFSQPLSTSISVSSTTPDETFMIELWTMFQLSSEVTVSFLSQDDIVSKAQ